MMKEGIRDSYKLHKITDAIEDIRSGKVVIVVDDENRENEGDFVAASEMATPEMINFMTLHGRGLICAPLLENRCNELDLQLMVSNNTDPNGTAFTVSVDLIGDGVTTGISAADRAKTILALTDANKKANHFSRPGHIFPLIAKEGGVLRRTGHTEAAIDLARLAGKKPAGVIVEIMNEDGTMARLPQLMEIADKFDLKVVSIEDLVAYRMRHDTLVKKLECFPVQTRFGNFDLHIFQQNTNDLIHYALTKGSWEDEEEVLTRVQSIDRTMDVIALLEYNQEDTLHRIFNKISKSENGLVLFMQGEYNPDRVLKKIQLYKDKMAGKSQQAVDLPMDFKDYGIGAQIIHQLGVRKIKLLTSHPIKRVGMEGYGLSITSNETY